MSNEIEIELDDDIDLIINCADQPSVDYTSKLIAKYAMENNIPRQSKT